MKNIISNIKKNFKPEEKPIDDKDKPWEGLPCYAKRGEYFYRKKKVWHGYMGVDERLDIAKFKNMLIAGKKSTGKTNLVRNILVDYLRKNQRFEVIIADINRSKENDLYRGHKKAFIAQSYESLKSKMLDLLEYAKNNDEKLKNTYDYSVSYMMLVVDDLSKQIPKEKMGEFFGIVRELSEFRRTTGIKIILSDSNPGANKHLIGCLDKFDQKVIFELPSYLDAYHFYTQDEASFFIRKGRAIREGFLGGRYFQAFDLNDAQARWFLNS